MKKEFIAMAMIGVLTVGTIGGTTAFAARKPMNVNPCQKSNTIILAKNDAKKEVQNLSLKFDNTKYEVVQPEGNDLISLTGEDKDNGCRMIYISWKHENSVTAENAANNAVKDANKDGGNAVLEKSDLEVDSTKVIKTTKYGSSSLLYFINDNNGGVYNVFVNVEAFTDKSEMADILKSIHLDTKTTYNVKNIGSVAG